MYKLKIKYYRLQYGLTQKQLAKLIGVKQSYISKLENTNRTESPTLRILGKLSDLFQVSINELTDSTGKYIPLLLFIFVKS